MVKNTVNFTYYAISSVCTNIGDVIRYLMQK